MKSGFIPFFSLVVFVCMACVRLGAFDLAAVDLSGGVHTWSTYRGAYAYGSTTVANSTPGGFTLPYRLYTPTTLEPGKKYPLVVMLHGVGSTGTDNEANLSGGGLYLLNYMYLRGMDAFILIPQAPLRTWQNYLDYKTTTAVMSAIDGLRSNQPIDVSRVYLTGFSMGAGSGIGVLYGSPEQACFAAFAPISGSYFPDSSTLAAGIASGTLRIAPIWSVNGEYDKGISESTLTNSLTPLGSTVHRTTILEGAGHNEPYDLTYKQNLAYWDWLFAQRNALNFTETNQPIVSVSTSSATLAEGGAEEFVFTRTGDPSVGPLTIRYMVLGTADYGLDYTPNVASTYSITIPQGASTATILVSAVKDTTTENPKTLSVMLKYDWAYRFDPDLNTRTLTIVDDGVNTPVMVNIEATDSLASEPTLYAGKGAFTLTRSGNISIPLTVNLMATGSATPGGDYTALPSTVTIPAGAISATVSVAPIDDSESEPDETVILNVFAGSGYSVGTRASATVNLYDDEAAQRVCVEVTDSKCIEQASVDVGMFTLRRLGKRNNALTVKYTIGGTATNGTDYTTLTGSATIAANSGSITVTVTPINDALVEGTETVILTLAAGTGYTADAQNTGTIELRDDEAVDVTLAVQDAICIEQPTPDTSSLRINRVVTTAMPVTAPLTVSYTVGGTATPGTDYTTLSGTATIPAGLTYVDVIVTPIDDALVEGPESVIMTLTGAGTTYDTGDIRNQTLWIRDNEVPTITVAATDATGAEAGGGTTNPGLYTFTASPAPSSDLTISYTMSSSAINGVDYAYLSCTIVLPAGQTTVTLAITPIDDELAEVAETASLTLVNTVQYNAGNTAAVHIVIAASDTPVAAITAVDAEATENPVDTGRFVVTLSKIVAVNTTVNYTIGGTATPTADYTALTGSVIVTPGANTATLTVTPVDDALVEGLEAVSATLASNGTLYTIGTPSAATVSIADLPPYTAWLNAFTFAQGADKTPTGDPDGDGVANLVEYALGLNATESNANPIALSQVTVNGGTYLQLSVSRNPAVTNVLIEGQSVGDLSTPNSWSSSTTVNDANNTTSVFTVRDSVPIGTTGKRFLRLRCTLLP